MCHKCQKCDKPFKRDIDLYNHVMDSCGVCQFPSCNHHFGSKPRRPEGRRHLREKHEKHPYNQCQRVFLLSASLESHMSDKHAISGFLFDLYLCNLNFEKLLDEKVMPDPLHTERCKKTVKHLKESLEKDFTIGNFVKGGSLGKGTSIKAKVDIDLVMFLNEIHSVAELRTKMTKTLKKMKNHVLTKKKYKIDRKAKVKRTGHSIQFKMKTKDGDETFDVDLLPACNLGKGPRKSIFDKMQELDREFYSACFSKDQKKFVKEVDGNIKLKDQAGPVSQEDVKLLEKIKNLIRLVKHWKRREDIRLVSYCIEIIVINQWIEWGKPKKFDLGTGFKKIAEKLKGFSRLQITWPSRYDGTMVACLLALL